MKQLPLVSVGLPTYNRAPQLARAIESVLSQTYRQLELIVSDNASTDDTQSLCEELSLQDERLRYIRQPTNQGSYRNFMEVLEQAGGQIFMWLGDDDWLDQSYLSRCVGALTKRADFSVVCGTARYFQDDQFLLEAEKINLLHDSPAERVLEYYRRVIRNGVFHGVMWRKDSTRLPLPRVLGGDWHFIASLAFVGKIQTLDDAFVNRSIGGESQTMQSIVASMGARKIHGQLPNVSIAISAFKRIVWLTPEYKSLGALERLSLGARIIRVFTSKYYLPYWRRRLIRDRARLKATWVRLKQRVHRLLPVR